jgi:hypothetical protein
MGTSQKSVQLTPTGHPVTWQMSLGKGVSSGHGNYPAIPVPYGDTGVATFTINNPGNISFAPDYPNPPLGTPSGPIYVQAGTAKPTKGVDSQFTYTLSANAQGVPNTVLTVTDSNKSAGTYTYVLNFNNAPQLDPIYQNGGGGTGFMNYSATTLLEAGAAILIALVVIGFLLRRFFPSARNKTKAS